MSKVGNTDSSNGNKINNPSPASNVATATIKKTATSNVDSSAPQALVSNDGATSKLGEQKNTAEAVKTSLDAKTPPSVLSKEATVTKTAAGEVVIDSGVGDDKIGVTQDVKTGDVTVNVNGESQTFTGKDRENLVIRAGEGNDSITVDSNVIVNIRMEGGDGDDFIRGGSGNDKIEGGKGKDSLHGGGGDDYINGSIGDDTIYGDAGNDVVYGGDGNDKIYGNDGNDYLEGSKGNDQVYGNAGNDVVSGGLGDDYLRGSLGDDVIYAGGGKDSIGGDSGNNKIYSQTDDSILKSPKSGRNTVVTVELKGNPGGTSVLINGSAEFRERVEADLEMMRSSPVGRQMLEGFDDSFKKDKVTVTLQSLDELNGYADWENRTKPGKPQPIMNPVTGAKGTPNNATISYNPALMPTFDFAGEPSVETTPNLVLFHEMAHAYDFTHGTFRAEMYRGNDTIDKNNIRVGERVAVGLPIDNDANPKTTEQTDNANHPDNLTENGLRREMNFRERMHYIITNMSRV